LSNGYSVKMVCNINAGQYLKVFSEFDLWKNRVEL